MIEELKRLMAEAARLDEQSQQELAEKLQDLLQEAWRQRRLKALEWIDKESPFRGLSEQLIAGAQEFRDGFAFKHDLTEAEREADPRPAAQREIA